MGTEGWALAVQFVVGQAVVVGRTASLPETNEKQARFFRNYFTFIVPMMPLLYQIWY